MQPFGGEVKYPEGTTQFWKDIFQAMSEPYEDLGYGEQVSGLHRDLMRPFRVEEIRDFVKSIKDGAAGVDGIRLPHLKKIPFGEIAEWFNLFLLRSEVWKTTVELSFYVKFSNAIVRSSKL